MNNNIITRCLGLALLLALPFSLYAGQTAQFRPFPATGAHEASFIERRNGISVIEYSGNYDKDADNGESNFEPRTVISKAFYENNSDAYDFLVVFSDFEFETGDAAAFIYGVKNEIKGIGKPVYDMSSLLGSSGQLRGYIDMAALSRWETNPLLPRFEWTLGVLGHEVLHSWAGRTRFKAANGEVSSKLIGKDDAHWSDLLDSDSSLLYGNKWRDNKDGTFTSVGTRKFFSPLDLYVSGFYSKEQVPPFNLIENPAHDDKQYPELGREISGVSQEITIEQIIAAEGERDPSYKDSQKEFSFAFVYLVSKGQPASSAALAQINNVRNAFMQRFSIWTQGKGIAHVYPEVQLNSATTGLEGLDNGGAYADNVDLDVALAWLRSQRREGGHWKDRDGTIVRDTAYVDAILDRYDTNYTDKDLAINWLQDSFVSPRLESSKDNLTSSNDDLAHFIASARGFSSEKRVLISTLITRQNSDGGWGVTAQHESDAVDTALALRAIYGKYHSPGTVQAGLGYIINSQNADGGWGGSTGTASSLANTLVVLHALKLIDSTNDAFEKALAYLSVNQKADGSLGTVQDTASTVSLFDDIQKSGGVDALKAIEFIMSQQGINGSWDGSVYVTSLVVDLLKQSNFPNWSIQEVSASKNEVSDGEKIQLLAKVINSSKIPTESTVIRISRESSGATVVVGSDITIPALLPGQSVDVRSTWDSFDFPGEHRFVFTVDPDSVVVESSKQDNVKALSINIKSAPESADISVSSSDMLLMPAQLSTLPLDVGVSTKLRNLGKTNAENVLVELFVVDVNEQEKISETTINFLSREEKIVNFSHYRTGASKRKYRIVVDGYNAVQENDESNNTAEIILGFVPTVDLVVDADGVVYGGSALLGDDAIFDVTLSNQGTTDASSLSVKYTILDNTEIIFEEVQQLQLNAGASADYKLKWRVERTGDLTLQVEIDSGNLVPEVDETNNVVQLDFQSGRTDAPNLSINFADFTFEPEQGLEGKPLLLKAKVLNSGIVTLEDVQVAFYRGSPENQGQLLDTLIISELLAGEFNEVQLSIARQTQPGESVYYAVIDPEDKIAEFRENDNQAFNVLTTLALPDAAINSSDVQLLPSFPQTGTQVTARVQVSNLGGQALTGFEVGVANTPDAAIADFLTIGLVNIGARETAIVDLSLQYDGQEALYLILDPKKQVEESDESNNLVKRMVVAQQADFFVDNKYISPNGDGVLESTRFYYTLDDAQEASVSLYRAEDKVRTLSSNLAGLSESSLVWDGKDDDGRVVDDGLYSVRVERAGLQLGAATVTVDNNRSLLTDSIGTKFELLTNMTCPLPSSAAEPFYRGDYIAQVDNGSKYIYYGRKDGGFNAPKTIHSYSTQGSVEEVVSASFFTDRRLVTGIASAPDLKKIAFLSGNRITDATEIWSVLADGSGLSKSPNSDTCSGGGSSYSSLCQHIIGLDEQGDNVYLVKQKELYKISLSVASQSLLLGELTNNIDLAGGSVGQDDVNWQDILLSPDRKNLVYTTAISSQHGAGVVGDSWNVWLVDLVTLTKKNIHTAGGEGIVQWSPDGKRLTIENRRPPEQFEMFTVVGDIEINIYTLNSDSTQLISISPTEANYHQYQTAWSTDSNELAVVAYKSQSQDCPRCSGFGPTDIGDQQGADFSKDNSGVVFTIDVRDGKKEKIKTYNELLGGYARLASGDDAETEISPGFIWVPHERSLIMASAADEFAEIIFLDKQNSTQELEYKKFAGILSTQKFPISSAQGVLHILDRQGSDDASSLCRFTEPDLQQFRSLANLTADLLALKSVTAGGVVLSGTVADAHFDRYTIDYAHEDSPDTWNIVQPSSTVAVINEVFTTWVPPRAGRFNVRLSVYDKAGNIRKSVQAISWNITPDISDVFREPAIFSPNGDGAYDNVRVNYKVNKPVHLVFQFFNQSGDLVRSIEQNQSEVNKAYAFTWDGRNDNGLILPSGEYIMRVHDYEFFIELDNEAPVMRALLSPKFYDVRYSPTTGPSKNVGSKPQLKVYFEDDLKPITIQYKQKTSDTWVDLNAQVESDSRKIEDPDTGEQTNVYSSRVLDDGYGLFENNHDLQFRVVSEDVAGNRTINIVGTDTAPFIVLEGVFNGGPEAFSAQNGQSLIDIGIARGIPAQQENLNIPYGSDFKERHLDFVFDRVVYKPFDENEYSVGGKPTAITMQSFAYLQFESILNKEIDKVYVEYKQEGVWIQSELLVLKDNFGKHEVMSYPQDLYQGKKILGTRYARWGMIDGPYTPLVAEEHRKTQARIKYVTVDSETFVSNSINIEFTTPGRPKLSFHGVAPVPRESIAIDYAEIIKKFGESNEVIGSRNVLRSQLSDDFDKDIEYSAKLETVYSFSSMELYVQSDEDPRYQNRQKISEVDFLGGEYIDFHAETTTEKKYEYHLPLQKGRLKGCTLYNYELVGNRVVLGESGEIEQVVQESSSVSGYTPCLEVKIEVETLFEPVCGNTQPADKRLTIKPVAHDGSALKLLKMSSVDNDGETTLIRVENSPESGVSYSFDISPSDFEEGYINILAELVNENEEKISGLQRVFIDKTPPQFIVSYPVGKVCAAAIKDPNPQNEGDERPVPGIRIDGKATDNSAVLKYFFDFENKSADTSFTYKPFIEGTKRPRTLATSDWHSDQAQGGHRAVVDYDGFVSTNAIGTLAILPSDKRESLNRAELLHGLLSMQTTIDDAAGFRRCPVVEFEVDASVDLSSIVLDKNLFSPNGDGVKDTVTIDYEVIEPVTQKLVLYKLNPNPNPLVGGFTQELIGVLSDNVSALEGSHAVIWQGTDHEGQVVADGLHQLSLELKDSCGNSTNKDFHVTVDNTPPSGVIASPRSGDALTTVVEISGFADDLHFEQYQLTLVEEANQENITTLLASEKIEPEEIVLTSWNTSGLEGAFILKLNISDLAGNVTEKSVHLDLQARIELINKLELKPVFFSPNGDDVVDKTLIDIGLLENVDLTIKVLKGEEYVATLFENKPYSFGSQTVFWDGLVDLLPNQNRPEGQPGPQYIVDGEYVLEVTARIAGGSGATQTESVTVYVDATFPAASIDQPDAGFVNGNDVVMFSVSDANFVAYQLDIKEGNKAWSLLVEGQRATNEKVVSSFSLYPEGEYSIRLTATDKAQNTTEKLRSFILDKTSPVISEYNVDVALLGVDSTAIKGSYIIDDEYLGKIRIGYATKSTPDSIVWLEDSAVEQDAKKVSKSFDLPIASLTDDKYELILQAEDKALNLSTKKIDFTVDRSAPLISLDKELKDFFQDTALLRLSINDLSESQYVMEYSPLNEGVAENWTGIGQGSTNSSDVIEYIWSPLPVDGVYSFRVTAKDSVENEAQASVNIHVDKTPPAAPLNLKAELLDKANIHFSWDAVEDEGLAGYELFINNNIVNQDSPIVVTEHLTAVNGEGVFTVHVRAIDLAGNTSSNSAGVEYTVDLTPPDIRLDSPSESFVTGVVELLGGISGNNDFKEYTIHVSPSTDLDLRQLLRRSPAPVISGVLAEWDTTQLEENSLYTIQILAEDIHENQASSEFEFRIDNLPPSAPENLQASANNSDASLSWSASPEGDVIGYLLFRNGKLANATGPVIGSLRPFVITQTNYLDHLVPDGAYDYEVYAMDEAGNISEASLPAALAIDARAPQANIVRPVNETAFDAPLFILAESEDIDIVSVQFQYKNIFDIDWLELAQDDSAPYDTTLDPEALSLFPGPYELRAIATDESGKTDTNPSSITIVVKDLVRPTLPTGLKAIVIGDEVELSWNASTDADISEYKLQSVLASDPQRKASYFIPAGQTSFRDENSYIGLGEYWYTLIAIDSSGNESDQSSQVSAVFFEPLLDSVRSPTPEQSLVIRGNTKPNSQVVFKQLVGATEVLLNSQSGTAGRFESPIITLLQGRTLFEVYAEDSEGNRSITTQQWVEYGARPSTPVNLVAIPSTTIPFAAKVSWDRNPELNVFGYLLKVNDELKDPSGRNSMGNVNSSGNDSSYCQEQNVILDNNDFWCPRDYSGYVKGQSIEIDYLEPQIISSLTLKWVEDAGVLYAPKSYQIEVLDHSNTWRVIETIENEQLSTRTITLEHPAYSQSVRLKIIEQLQPRYSYWSVRMNYFEVDVLPVTSLIEVDAIIASRSEELNSNFNFDVSAVNSYGFISDAAKLEDVPFGSKIPLEPAVITLVKESISATTISGAQVEVVNVTINGVHQYPSIPLSIEVYRNGELIHTIQTGFRGNGTFSYTDEAVINGQHEYKVILRFFEGQVSPDSNIEFVTVDQPIPVSPELLKAVAQPSVESIQLSWEQPVSPVPAAYDIYRRETMNNGAFTVINTVPDLLYTDQDVVVGVPYQYKVVARDLAGNVTSPTNVADALLEDMLAPSTPVIDTPTIAGSPLNIGVEELVTIEGTAEANAKVLLYKNGLQVAETQASSGSVEATEFFRSSESWDAILSESGRYLAWANNIGEGIITVRDVTLGATSYTYHLDENLSFDQFHWSGEVLWIMSEKEVELPNDEYEYVFEIESYSPEQAGAFEKVAVISGMEYVETFTVNKDQSQILISGDTEDIYGILYHYDIANDSLRELFNLHDDDEAYWADIQWDKSSQTAYLLSWDNSEIRSVDITTGQNTILVNNVSNKGVMSLSPNEQYIAYSAQTADPSSSTSELLVYSLATGVADVITINTGIRQSFITWMDDSKLIVAQSNLDLAKRPLAPPTLDEQIESRKEDLFEVNVSTGKVSSLVDIDGFYEGFVWANGIAAAEDVESVLSSNQGPLSGGTVRSVVIPTHVSGNPRFTVPDVALAQGQNDFSVEAVDAAGNVSPVSATITIHRHTEPLANLKLAQLSIEPAVLKSGELSVARVSVSNIGELATPETQVKISALSPSGTISGLDQSLDVPPMQPGDTVILTVSWTADTDPGVYKLSAIVDPDDHLTEQTRLDNQLSKDVLLVTEGELPSLQVELGQNELEADETLEMTIRIQNTSASREGKLYVTVEDEQGVLVDTISSGNITLPFGAIEALSRTWNSGQIFSGSYKVVATLLDGNKNFLSGSEASFVINPQVEIHANLLSDSAIYHAHDNVLLTISSDYVKGNVATGSLQGLVEISSPTATVLFTEVVQLGDLIPGNSASANLVWNTGINVAGSYSVSLKVLQSDGSIVAEKLGQFDIAASGVKVTANMTPETANVDADNNHTVSFEVSNIGNAGVIGLPLRLLVLQGGSEIKAEYNTQLNVPLASTASEIVELSTSSFVVGSYDIILQAMHRVAAGGEPLQLTQAKLVIADREPPVVTIVSPIADGFVSSVNGEIQATAIDKHSEISLVEMKLDNNGWQSILETSQGNYSFNPVAVSQGAHTVFARAIDSAQNSSEEVQLSFTLDSVYPLISISGVSDESFYNLDITPEASITDVNLLSTEVKLNEEDFILGDTLSEEGAYRLIVRAEDKAGNASSELLSFSIDKTYPEITVSGVENGQYYAAEVTPEIVVSDVNLQFSEVKLNNQDYEANTVVSAEGDYVLNIMAIDKASNTSHSTINFSIDKTPPQVVITAPDLGVEHDTAVIDIRGTTDPGATVFLRPANGSSVSVLADDDGFFLFIANELAEGANQFTIFALDKAGNQSEPQGLSIRRAQTFKIELEGRISPLKRTLAWLPEENEQQQRILEKVAELRKTTVEVVFTKTDFIRELRSGLYGSVVLADVEGRNCKGHRNYHYGWKDHGYKSCAWWKQNERMLSSSVMGELRPMIATGLGVMLIKTHKDHSYRVSDIFGAVSKPYYRHTHVDKVVLQDGPASEQGEYALQRDRAIRLVPVGGTVSGSLLPANRPAMVVNKYEKGNTVVIGFNAFAVEGEENATNIIKNAINYIQPQEAVLLPGAALNVDWIASGFDRLASVRLESDAHDSLNILEALGGEIVADGSSVNWSRNIDVEQSTFDSVVRLPNHAGTKLIDAELFLTEDGLKQSLDTASLTIELLGDVESKALDAVSSLHPRGFFAQIRSHRIKGWIKRALRADHGTKSSLEDSIHYVVHAHRLMYSLPVDSYQARQATGQLLRYYQSLWYDLTNGEDIAPELEFVYPYNDVSVVSFEDSRLNRYYDTSVTLKWIDEDPDSNARISLYYDDDKKDANGQLIVSDIKEDVDNHPFRNYDYYEWDVAPIPEGQWYVYAVIEDDSTSKTVYLDVAIDHWKIKKNGGHYGSHGSHCRHGR